MPPNVNLVSLNDPTDLSSFGRSFGFARVRKSTSADHCLSEATAFLPRHVVKAA